MKTKTLNNTYLRIFLLALILGVITGYTLEIFGPVSIQDKVNQITNNKKLALESQLPSGWKAVEDKSDEIILKLVKQTDNGIVPTVTVIKSQTDTTDYKQYIENLKSGVRSTISTLKYLQDVEGQKGGFYLRHLSGEYSKGKSTINIEQYVYIKNNVVYTTTLSFQKGSDLLSVTVIDQLISHIFNTYINTSA